ncbi:MAG: dihydropteroate synthase [bacterium]|nr:dihydropteroate synthase [bacterium]
MPGNNEEKRMKDTLEGSSDGLDERGNDIYPVYRLPPLSPREAEEYLRLTGCSEQGVGIMRRKFTREVIKVPEITAREAIMLKQDMLSLGGEACVSENSLRDLDSIGDVVLEGTHKQLWKLSRKLKAQPFSLPSVGSGIAELIENSVKKESAIVRGGGRTLGFPPARVMGILNVTPDSFSDGGKFFSMETAVEQAIKMVEEGVDIIDVGGESTRPFSSAVSVNEELDRVIPVIEELRKRTKCLISVDTYKSDVAQKALEAGAHIVNDIYALRYNEDMAEVIRQYDAGVVLMHMKGKPSDMQTDPRYDDVIKEIYLFLRERSNEALEAGIPRDKIMVDPGIGFGKRLCDNLEIIRCTGAFSSLGFPVLIGPSRKGFIGQITGRKMEERLSGTVAVSTLAAFAGADVLRVHDVGEIISSLKMTEAVVNHLDHR